MKKPFLLATLILVITVLCSMKLLTESEGDPEQKKFAEELLAFAKKPTYDDFKKRVITDKEFTELVNGSTMKEEQKTTMLQKLANNSPDKNVEAWYNDFSKQSGILLIDYSKAENIEYIVQKSTERGLEFGRARIKFTFNGKGYEMKARDMIKGTNGWKLLGPLKVKCPEDEEKEMRARMEEEEKKQQATRTIEETKYQQRMDSLIQKHQKDSVEMVKKRKAENEKKKKSN
ncbi:MAG TPA: hypothetical protein VK177_14645 [Flavobacteriales bacterium]|nr:hypothetical protein [Flavobacteriales bacterium]